MLVIAPIVEMRRLTGTHLIQSNTSFFSSKSMWETNANKLKTDTLLAILVPLSILLYLALAPYTKVEESFNLQATHDILTYGLPINQVESKLRAHYDHLTFSGSVPRTFVGPLALAAVSWPGSLLLEGLNKQILGRPLIGDEEEERLARRGWGHQNEKK